MKVKVTVDREEEGILVLIGENGKKYEMKKDSAGVNVREGDVCTAKISFDGKVLKLEKNSDLTERKKAEMKARLSRLFSKKKQ